MTSFRQFWTLFRFQLEANPYIGFMAIAFCAPIFPFNSLHESLMLLIPTQNIFFVGFLGVMLLAPEILYSPSTSNQWSTYSSEFLLTRAVDRRVLERAKAGCFYFISLAVPLLLLAYSLKSPDLKVDSYSKSEQQECVAAIPGTAVLKNASGQVEALSIPAGRRIVASWHCWKVIGAVALVQVVVFLVYPWRYRRAIFWVIFSIFILVPLVRIYAHAGSHFDGEHLFFIFAGHQALFWIVTVFLIGLAQLWCEWRFTKLEL